MKNQTCPPGTCDSIQQIYSQNSAVLPYQQTKNSLTCPITQSSGTSSIWWIFLLIIGLIVIVLVVSFILVYVGLIKLETPEATERPVGVVGNNLLIFSYGKIDILLLFKKFCK